MANTYTNLNYHIIYSTKGRAAFIAPTFEEQLWAYMAGIAKDNDCFVHRIGGIEDHVHLVLSIPASLAVARLVQLVKGGSSRWIHESYPTLAHFGWQDGYAAFTVSRSVLPEVIHYAANQREHHRQRTFTEEYRLFLERHGVEFEERYAFD
jgi:REP element-mobilizing transposase RayT